MFVEEEDICEQCADSGFIELDALQQARLLERLIDRVELVEAMRDWMCGTDNDVKKLRADEATINDNVRERL